MSSPRLEAFLAQLYVDAGARRRFLADPSRAARDAGLGDAEAAALARIDRVGLEMAAASFGARRGETRRRRRAQWQRLVDALTARARWR